MLQEIPGGRQTDMTGMTTDHQEGLITMTEGAGPTMIIAAAGLRTRNGIKMTDGNGTQGEMTGALMIVLASL